MRRRLRRWFTTLWPGFFAAAVIELGVFAFVDPRSLHGLEELPGFTTGPAGELNPLAVQSLAFVFFWAAVSAAIATARWLDAPAH